MSATKRKDDEPPRDDADAECADLEVNEVEFLGRHFLTTYTLRYKETVVERRIRIGPFMYAFHEDDGSQIAYRYTSVIDNDE